MGTLIVVGVIALVLVLFVGLVWLFVKISSSPEAKARAAELDRKAGLPAPSSSGRRSQVPETVKTSGSVPPRKPGNGSANRKKQGGKTKGRKTP